MLAVIFGGKGSGKKELVKMFHSIGFTLNTFKEIYNDKEKRHLYEKNVIILERLQDWYNLTEIPNVKLFIIFSSSNSKWRKQNDDLFYKEISMEKNKIQDAIFVDNFGSLEDFKQINLLQYFDKPSWDEYFMRLAELISRRSSCIRKHVGAVLVSNKIIVSTGYNGTPFGLENCNKLGCKKCARTESLNGIETCICLHAEENAIMSSCKIARDDLHLYTTLFPCRLCIKQSVQRGIKKIIYRRAYKDYEEGITILRNANIDVMHLA